MKLERFYKLTAKSNINNRIILTDSSTGIILHHSNSSYGDNIQLFEFYKLWRGDFSLFINNKRFDFKTTGSSNTIKLDPHTLISYKRYFGIREGARKIWGAKKRAKRGWDDTFRLSDNVISVCKYLDDALKKNTGIKGLVIPIPINLEDFPKNHENMNLKSPSILLIQNHQIKQKSEALINFNEVIKKLPEVNFYISKGLPENQNIYSKKVIKTLSKNNNVHFVDINSSNKYDYLSSCDIYALVSGLDCTPATILEASLAKKPIVASAVGGVPEMIINGSTGYSLENDNTEMWAKTINKLAGSKKMRQELGESAYKYVIKNYELNIISKKILEKIS